jgi:hypothetical protein
VLPTKAIPFATAGDEITWPSVWNFHLTRAELGDTGGVVYAGVGQIPAEHGGILADSNQTEKERGEQRTAKHFHPE